MTNFYFLSFKLSFVFIKVFSLPPIEALALFLYGCSPGGSGSNNWTILFDGDIDLSAIMTFVSTMSSLCKSLIISLFFGCDSSFLFIYICFLIICQVMMPLWIYTLGSTLTTAADIKLPIFRLVLNLFATIGPCLLGLLLSKLFPKLKCFIMKYIKQAIVVLILSFLGLIIISKYYVFTLITWQQWVAGPLIPWTGFLLGALFAWITKRETKVYR